MVPFTGVNVVGVGDGDPVVLVHGSGPSWGEETFLEQRPLAEEYKLLFVDRRGYGDSPATDRVDFDVDAEDISKLLGEGAHLVGHSYGGLVSLLAAGRRPDAVRSLTVIEPPALGVARGNEAVENFIGRLKSVYANAGEMSPEEYWIGFLRALGFENSPLPKFTEKELRGIRATMTERPPWEATIPIDKLVSASFPKLIVSGDWGNVPPMAKKTGGAALHAVCDVLEDRLTARREVFQNTAHNPQLLGEPFNEKLRRFLGSA